MNAKLLETKGSNDDCVRIFDTTLRDGEQSPGASMTTEQKLEVAQALARLGVDVIEAGFPAASPADLEAVRQIAMTVGRAPRGTTPAPTIAGLTRLVAPDIDRTWEAVREASSPRIHTFLATSDIHLEHKLRMTRDQALERIREGVAHARRLCPDVEFSPEDGSRTEPGFLAQVFDAACEAGATTFNLPDTVGYSTPSEFSTLVRGLVDRIGSRPITVSVHCHDDLGMATANTLAAIQAGARQAEVTINGIGERAGNTALEEVVMALRTRRDAFPFRTGIDTTRIADTSRLVSRHSGMVVQPNKAIVGANAFAHESGVHQDGVLKHHSTYEIMRPESVGVDGSKIVLGKHSGRAALRARVEELGYKVPEEAMPDLFERFKRLADRRKIVTNADLATLIPMVVQ